MASKRAMMQGAGLFGTKPTNEGVSARDFTAAGYSDMLSMIEDSRLVAEPVRIVDIQPDSMQPRRIVPATVRTSWSGRTDPATMSDLLARWWGMADIERAASGRSPFDLSAYLELKVDSDADAPDPGPIEAAWIDLVNLAASIRHDGLTNAITVAQVRENLYKIETGERRWLAYHLLMSQYPNDVQWQKIPARIVPEVSVWRQAAENGARQNLNAIGKARQYALLIMQTAMEADVEVKFMSMDACEDETAFYRQAHELRIPHGQRERIMQAMGVSSTSEITVCRDLLLLHHGVCQYADDHNVSQAALLRVRDMSEADAIKQLQKMFDDRAFSKTPPKGGKSGGKNTPDTRKVIGSVWKAYAAEKPIKRADFEVLKEWIAEVEQKGKFEE